MKILFYVEPWVEMQNPDMKSAWVKLFSKKIITSLNKFGIDKFEYYIICGDSLESLFKQKPLNLPYNASIRYIKTDDLLSIFNNTSEATYAWQNHLYTQRQSILMQDLISEQLDKFSPDVCITYTEAPFLKELFPQSLVTSCEYGFISRPPYPETLFFDIFGTYNNSYIKKYSNELEKLNEFNKDFLDKFKTYYSNIFLSNEVQFSVLDKYRKKYDYLVLLPTQFNGVQGWDSNCQFDSQLSFILSIMKNIDERIGVILSHHPSYQFLMQPRIRRYLRALYPNIIIDGEILKTINASQILLTQVDALISVSSSLIFQSVINDKPVFIPTSSYLSIFSQNSDISLISKYLDNKIHKCKKAIMYHLMTHYYLSEKYISDGEYLYKYFQKLIKMCQTGDINLPYSRIDNDTNLLNSLLIDSKNDQFLKDRFKNLEKKK